MICGHAVGDFPKDRPGRGGKRSRPSARRKPAAEVGARDPRPSRRLRLCAAPERLYILLSFPRLTLPCVWGCH